MFRSLAEEDLAALAAAAQQRVYERNELLREADEAHGLAYLLMRGSVRIYRASPAGQEVTLATPHAGELFALVRGDQAMALCAGTQVYRFCRERLIQLVSRHPPLVRAVWDLMECGLAEGRDHMADLRLGSSPIRLRRLLVRLAANDPQQRVLLTREELAQQIGAGREDVTRTLRTLRERGLIAVQPHRREIVVLDLEGLMEL